MNFHIIKIEIQINKKLESEIFCCTAKLEACKKAVDYIREEGLHENTII